MQIFNAISAKNLLIQDFYFLYGYKKGKLDSKEVHCLLFSFQTIKDLSLNPSNFP